MNGIGDIKMNTELEWNTKYQYVGTEYRMPIQTYWRFTSDYIQP